MMYYDQACFYVLITLQPANVGILFFFAKIKIRYAVNALLTQHNILLLEQLG